jgi:outer membrane protein assembly factor BamB/TolB-like protein/DNA-binding winged helix-turn-helix (wHTH) protein
VSGARFNLGEFQIRPDLNEIEGPDGTTHVNPKAMEVLLALTERPDELCTKREILDTVWTDLFVGDEVLTTAVWELRRALGDSARSPRFIQTVSRKGYRLLVAPTPIDPGVLDGAGVVAAESSRSPRVMVALASLAVVLAVVVFVMTRSAEDQRRVPEIRSLVVLPIDDLGDDRNDQALADGLTDTLITALARIDGVRVVSRTTATTYRHRELTVSEIAAELGVDAVVEGTLARSGDRIVLNAQLIDARSESHLWAETYERRFESLLDLQVEVARSIGAAISSRLDPEPNTRVAPAVDTTASGETLLRWRFQTGGEVWSTPVATGGAVVFGSRDGTLYSVRTVDGAELWRRRIGDQILTQALVLDDAIFAAAHDGTIVAVSSGDGRERWRFHTGGEIESPLVGDRGVVVVAAEDGRVVALDASSGRELWTWAGGEGVDGLACRDGAVIASGFDGTVTRLDAIDGAMRWQIDVAEWLGLPVTIDRDQILVPAPGGHIIALEFGSGRELWRAPTLAPSEITVWRDRVVVGGGETVIRALDRMSGAELWRFDALGGTTRPSLHDGVVYAGARDDNLYAIDAWTGALRWRAEMRTWVTTPAVPTGDGIIFGSLDGSVTCLRPPASEGVVIRERDGFVAVSERGDERPRGFDIIVTGEGVRRPTLRWRIASDGPVLHAPAITDTTVLACGYQNLTAVDLETGEARWKQRLPGESGTRPVLLGDSVVVGTRDGYAVAYGIDDGVERWRFATAGAVISTPVEDGGTLYFGSRDGFLYALDPLTGGERWRRQLETIHASPLPLGEEVWVTSRGDTLWVLAAADGRVLRTLATADWAVAEPIATADRVIIASSDGSVQAFARSDGRKLWQVATSGEIWYRPLLQDGRYLFGSADHHLYALDVATGRELWRRRTGNRVLSSVAGWGDLVFVGSHDRSLHAFRADDGQPQWRLATTGVVGNPSIEGNLLGFGSFDGFLYLLELD